jgi:hypothetical protein
MCQSQDRCPQVDFSNVIIVLDLQIVFVFIHQVLLALLPPSTFPFKHFLFLDAIFEPLAEDNEARNISQAHTAVIFIQFEVTMAGQEH